MLKFRLGEKKILEAKCDPGVRKYTQKLGMKS